MNNTPLTSASISREGLEPLRHKLPGGGEAFYFVDNHIDIVKIDFIFPAGSAFQEKKLQASSTIRLITEGTAHHTAHEIAEFMDFRGIAMEKNADEVSATLTVYSLRRYLGDLLPLLREIITEPAYPDEEFLLFVDNRRRHLLTKMMRTSYVARNIFYESLYGTDHPMGQYAVPEDFDNLTVEDVRRFHRNNIRTDNATIIIGGHVDDGVLALFDNYFGDFATSLSADATENKSLFANPRLLSRPTPIIPDLKSVICHSLPGAVQNTLRVGRLLPMRWDSLDYSRFMVLSTLLGGYFGSRLMSNIREDKGYTYGIYSQTRICRGGLIFSIITDVASDVAEQAMSEILYELQRLREEPVPDSELDLVRKCMLGDFMRSVDGIFERCERFGQQLTAGIDERFTDNFFHAIDTVTPSELQQLAKQLLPSEELLKINVGIC